MIAGAIQGLSQGVVLAMQQGFWSVYPPEARGWIVTAWPAERFEVWQARWLAVAALVAGCGFGGLLLAVGLTPDVNSFSAGLVPSPLVPSPTPFAWGVACVVVGIGGFAGFLRWRIRADLAGLRFTPMFGETRSLAYSQITKVYLWESGRSGGTGVGNNLGICDASGRRFLTLGLAPVNQGDLVVRLRQARPDLAPAPWFGVVANPPNPR